MRLLWLTRYGPEGASSRYRVFQYLEALREHGIHSEVRRLAPWRATRLRSSWSVGSRLLTMLQRIDADVIVVQKAPVMPPSLWPVARRLLQRQRAPIVFDLDDAIWANSVQESRMAEGMCRLAHTVVAGNELIAAWARRHGANDVVVIPTCFSPTGGPTDAEPIRSGSSLVWIGSPSTASLLADQEHRIREILDSGATLTMVGGEPPDSMRDLPITTRPWSPENEHQLLRAADYGLALQPRTEFADHKCGFKIVQYLSYGVVPIATDNPVHRRIMGGVGLLIAPDSTTAEITSFVSRGVSPREREDARRRWRSAYSTAVGAEAWERVLAGVVT